MDRWGIQDADLVAATCQLLDCGQIVDGLNQWGVKVEDRLARLLTGEAVQFGLREQTQIWNERAVAVLAGSAPWLLARANERSDLVREAWSQVRRGKSHRSVRLFGLGVQNQQRRPGVFLARMGAEVHLKLDWSASNARVPAFAWMGPVDYDLVRLGFIEPRIIPNQ